jgi:hypothetical protein
MKSHPLLSVSLLAALAALSSLVQAEDKAAPAAEAKAEKAAPPATRPHAHLQDKTKHYHPRDMK